MKKQYEAPMLFVDKYAPDTMIASGGSRSFTAKNGNPNNQNCYGYKSSWGQIVGDDYCIYT